MGPKKRSYMQFCIQFQKGCVGNNEQCRHCTSNVQYTCPLLKVHSASKVVMKCAIVSTLPPERTQPQKLCTANFSSGTLKTLIDGPLWLKNKIFWRRPAEHFSSLPRARTPLSSGQKWVLRPDFLLIGGIFVLKSGLRFSFRAPEVP